MSARVTGSFRVADAGSTLAGTCEPKPIWVPFGSLATFAVTTSGAEELRAQLPLPHPAGIAARVER